MINRYKEAFSTLGLDVSDLSLELLIRYAQMIQVANRQFNLTAVSDDAGILYRHLIDSCQVLRFMTMSAEHHFVDIGSGAGFPGIPLAIVSQANGLLVDALKKRVDFLTATIASLGISGIAATHSRVELLGRPDQLRATFDYGFSRAVTQLPILLEYAMPLLKVGGLFVAYKSQDVDDERHASLAAMQALNCEIYEIYEYTDIYNINRKLMVFHKFAKTPERYPRRVGIANKRPLGS